MVSGGLPDIPIFEQMSKLQIEDLSEWLVRSNHPNGHIFFREGEPPSGLYVLAKGRVAVMRDTPNGPAVITELDGPSVFGEMSLLTRETRSSSVVARTDVIVGRLDLAVFDEKIAQGHLTAYRLAYNVGRIATHRLRWALDRLIELSHIAPPEEVSQEKLAAVTRRLSGILKAVGRKEKP